MLKTKKRHLLILINTASSILLLILAPFSFLSNCDFAMMNAKSHGNCNRYDAEFSLFPYVVRCEQLDSKIVSDSC